MYLDIVCFIGSSEDVLIVVIDVVVIEVVLVAILLYRLFLFLHLLLNLPYRPLILSHMPLSLPFALSTTEYFTHILNKLSIFPFYSLTLWIFSWVMEIKCIYLIFLRTWEITDGYLYIFCQDWILFCSELMKSQFVLYVYVDIIIGIMWWRGGFKCVFISTFERLWNTEFYAEMSCRKKTSLEEMGSCIAARVLNEM